jgi:GWxTD domain-containing protein
MSGINWKIALATALLSSCLFCSLQAVAQARASADSSKWLNEVSYIISDSEREYYLSLQSNSERERFIDGFWELRDPTPDTERNEFREEHYRRLAKAEREYDLANKMGLKSSIGQVYILLGEPLKQLTFTDPALNGPVYAWYYPPDKSCGIKYHFFIVFFKPGGRIYRIYNPSTYGPSDLISGDSGAVSSSAGEEEALNRLLHIDPLLGQLSLSLLPQEHSPIMMDNKAELRKALSMRTPASKKLLQMVLDSRNFRQQESMVKLKAVISRKPGEQRGDSWVRAEFNGSYRFDVFRDDTGEPKLYFSLFADSEQISMNEYRGRSYSVLSISLVARNDSGSTAGSLEDVVSAVFGYGDRARGGITAVAYQGTLNLKEGVYQVTATIRNPVDRRFFELNQRVEIPRSIVRTMTFGPSMLILSREKAEGEGANSSYQFGGERYLPNVSNVIAMGEEGQVYYQLYFARNQRVSDVTVQYEVLSAGRVLWKSSEKLDREMMLPGGTISQTVRISTSRLPAGHYVLQLTAVSSSPPIVRSSMEFDIVGSWNAPAIPKLAETTR